MDELRAGVRRKLPQHQISIFTIGDTSTDLDQFMIMQGLPEFANHAVCQASLADQYERMQRVTEAPQVFFLTIREWHVLIIGPHAGIHS